MTPTPPGRAADRRPAHLSDPRTGPTRPDPACLAHRVVRALRPSRCVERADREPQPEDQEHPADRTRLPQTSPTTDCDYRSTTDASATITHRRGSGPAVP